MLVRSEVRDGPGRDSPGNLAESQRPCPSFLDTGALTKGGTVECLFRHANGIARADSRKRDDDGNLVWGKLLKDRIKAYFSEGQHLRFEVFNDWTPVDDCRVGLDLIEKDKWGLPVARVRLGYHQRDLAIGRFVAPKAAVVLEQMGGVNVTWGVNPAPPQNLVAGGCRFGTDPRPASWALTVVPTGSITRHYGADAHSDISVSYARPCGSRQV